MTTFCSKCGMQTVTYTIIGCRLICKNCWDEREKLDDNLSGRNPILDKMGWTNNV